MTDPRCDRCFHIVKDGDSCRACGQPKRKIPTPTTEKAPERKVKHVIEQGACISSWCPACAKEEDVYEVKRLNDFVYDYKLRY